MKALLIALALGALTALALPAPGEVAPDSTDLWDFAPPHGPMFGPTLVDTTGAHHHLTVGSVNIVPALHDYDPPCAGYDREAKARVCYQTIPSPFSSMPTVFAFVADTCALRIEIFAENDSLQDAFDLGRLAPNVYGLRLSSTEGAGGKFHLTAFADSLPAGVVTFWE